MACFTLETMSNLAEALEALMEKSGIRYAAELARRANVEESAVSRWRNGLQTSITDEDLEKLSRALSNDAKDHARLVAARMLDVRHGPGAELITVEIDKRELREEPQPYGQKKLPPKGRE